MMTQCHQDTPFRVLHPFSTFALSLGLRTRAGKMAQP
jgi:hypothetical protein